MTRVLLDILCLMSNNHNKDVSMLHNTMLVYYDGTQNRYYTLSWLKDLKRYELERNIHRVSLFCRVGFVWFLTVYL
jgi:hypothetical protein